METSKPYIIAGPCSAESREQLAATAEALSALPEVDAIRCGVWKPRTRPGGFEGFGAEALQWIQELKQERPQLRFACEVARPEHAELALRYGMDILWIGARTTANPFMVQELTEALRGAKVRMLVKNAPSPDLSLWMGAIERCRKVGLTDVMAVLRGFDVFKNASYRNNPLWEIPIELRHRMPETPMLCDPSHIAGRHEPIPELCQTAMDLGFEGLMVEVHPHPEEAMTDASQQITPAELERLLRELTVRRTDRIDAGRELRLFREQIDHLDKQMIQLLAARLDLVRQIAAVKAQNGMTAFQPKRWEELQRQRTMQAQEMSLDPGFVKELFEKIHAESIRIQEQEISNKKKI